MSLNDWWCKPEAGGCGREWRNVVLPAGEAPRCCGHPEAMVTLWDHGKAPATDLHEPQFNHATGQWHRSHREAEMTLAKQARAWSERTGMKYTQPIAAGDRVHGARDETRRSGSAFGYAGQVSRRSTAEGGPPERGRYVRDSTPAPQADTYTVNGVSPRRMTREQAAAYRASPQHD